MKKLKQKIKNNPALLVSIQECEKVATHILQRFITNFPEYTDHSIVHSKTVIGYIENLIGRNITKLSEDEAYILIMAGFLHDIGQCPTNKEKKEIIESQDFKNCGKSFENYLRDIHHQLSNQYINTHWKKLGIINEQYAQAIGLVGMGHRIVDLLDFDIYEPEFTLKSGEEHVCLPYLAAVLRLADELDITDDRIPELLYSEYFPNNQVSKKEWEKHRANYIVAFKGESIIIQSKCSDKELYYSLIKQYSKIEKVISEVQKITYLLPQNHRQLKIGYTKLERNIITIGFIPKNIGFSFDLQNTIDTFIGKNLYREKFVAIRECLQNSIDSCRYKYNLPKHNYVPKITIQLTKDRLIVVDNGFGMDEFVIKNYFSRLAKSYYADQKEIENFESISQFGIGVFSYFLISEFFEVATKKENSSAIRFRAHKNADSYFHFYESSDKKESGTEITFFLNDELDIEELIHQVRHYIRFVEIPIEIIYEDEVEVIECLELKIDRRELLKREVGIEYLENLDNLEILEAHIDNSNCNGVLGMLVKRDEFGTIIPINTWKTLHSVHLYKVGLSQKGIFVGYHIQYTFSNIIGLINLKKKNEIDLGRYHITDKSSVTNILEEFHYILITKLFENWNNKELSTQCNLWEQFNSEYFYKHDYFPALSDKLVDCIYCRLYDGKSTSYLLISDLINLNKFFLVSVKANDNLEKIHELLLGNIVYSTYGKSLYFIVNYFSKKGNGIVVRAINGHWYFEINPNTKNKQDNSKELGGDFLTYDFDNDQLCSRTYLWTEYPFNLNHEIVKFYKKEKKNILNKPRLNLLFKDFFQSVSNLLYSMYLSEYKPTSIYIDNCRLILLKINTLTKRSFSLSKKDFADWINEKIKW